MEIGTRMIDRRINIKWKHLNKDLMLYLNTYMQQLFTNDADKKYYVIDFSDLKIIDSIITTNNDLILRVQCRATVFEPKKNAILSMSIEEIDKKNNFIVFGNHFKGFKVFVRSSLETSSLAVGQIKDVQLEALKNRKQDIIAIGNIHYNPI
jgi:DNA-directed RNA polymerase subunit E'/Rpb7